MDPRAVAELSARQMGTFSRAQLLELDVSPAAIRWAVGSGRWTREHPGVYGIAGVGHSWHRRLWAAHLHAGPESLVGGFAAARIHGFGMVPRSTVDLIVPASAGRAPSGVRWHRVIDLAPVDRMDMGALPPLTTPARTVVDVAGVLHIARLRLLVEDGLARRRFGLPEVGVVLDRVRRRGKPGVQRLARVLDDLGPGADVARSSLEREFDRLVDGSGLPAPVREHPLPNTNGRAGFVDRCWPDAKLIVELDGRRWHHRFQQALKDADRVLEAQASGWETLRLLWEHVVSDPVRTLRNLEVIYANRRRLLAG